MCFWNAGYVSKMKRIFRLTSPHVIRANFNLKRPGYRGEGREQEKHDVMKAKKKDIVEVFS